MDSVLEAIFHFVVEVLKLILYVLIWSYVLFYIGVLTLKLLSLFKYPVGKQYKKHVNVISFVGLNTIYTTWAAIASFNFSENMFLLVIGLIIAIVQFFLIATKYYSEYRNYI